MPIIMTSFETVNKEKCCNYWLVNQLELTWFKEAIAMKQLLETGLKPQM